MVEDDVVRRIHCLADFLQHDIPLARQLRLVEQAVLVDVAEDIDGERQVALERLAEEGRRLARRPGVDMAADRLDLVGDVLCAAARRALEHHVFEQVGHAVDLGRFVARAGVDPDAAGHRLDLGHGVGRDPEPAGKRRNLRCIHHPLAALALAST